MRWEFSAERPGRGGGGAASVWDESVGTDAPLPEVPVVAGLGCQVEDGLHKAGLPVSSLASVSEQNGIR